MNPRFPVLIYHGIVGGRVSPVKYSGKYVISEQKFVEQLDEIRNQNLAVVSLKAAWSNGKSTVQARGPLVLTFDDGLASNYEIAFPLLLRQGMEADFFINPAAIGKTGYLSWQEIASMQRFGMSFHSHSQEHIDLTRLPLELLTEHLRVSKRSLEDRLGCSVDFLAAPYGLLNGRVVDVAAQEGYLAVCNSVSEPTMARARSINRIAVYRHTPMPIFRQILRQRPFPFSVRKVRSALLYLPKQLLLRCQPSWLGVTVSESHIEFHH